jgi:4-hydroxybenzoate polyprenyltransferase
VRAAALVALAAAVPLSLAAGAGFAAAHLTAAGCALAYNAGLKKRPVSVLPYAVAFALLPIAVGFALPAPRWAAAWAVVASALAGAGGHFTQALPDIPTDRGLGVRGLPQVIGQRASAAAAAALLLAANGTIALAAERPPLALVHAALAVVLAGGIVAAALRYRPRLAFRLTLGSAALAVLAFLASGGAL